MTFQKFHALRIDAEECSSFESYAAECGGSLPAEYIDEEGNADKAVNLLQYIWAISRNWNFATVLNKSGLSNVSFAREYIIPLRTVENWKHGYNDPPAYVLEMVAWAVAENIF